MVRLITEKFKELHEITASENKGLKQRVAELEMTVAKNKQDIEKLEIHESTCQQELIRMNEKYRTFREWVIFTFGKKGQKPPPK